MQWIALLSWLVLCFAVAGIGGWCAADDLAGWYRTLVKPRIAPPTWVFGPIWTALYALMAIAAWQVWLSPSSPMRTKSLTLFLIQLALNLAWPWIFFREHEIGAALAEVILLWIVIGATTMAFGGLVPLAAWLMAPYWAWTSFAILVNAAFWLLNREYR
jgi:translocator protein